MIGTTLGPYRILARLGEGGMGEVYQAEDTRLGRTIALKILRSDRHHDLEARRRLMREARAASALNHPGILTVHEIGSEGDLDYIAMEYVAGGTLAGLLDAGPLPVPRALELAAQVADALTAAHESGLVHRDLKPANIMLSGQGRAKVVDFGLAKRVEVTATGADTVESLTAPGTILGTAPYMSPEQATGQALDARSDLFSFGAILYEMLAGRRPFGGAGGTETLAAILKDDPAPIPGLQPKVASLVERCLRKEPDRRFQSARELKEAIETCLESRPGGGRPSIAVLAFTNMSGEREDDYLCEGLSEEIINALTGVAGLRVIARTSAFAIGRMGLDVREIGTRLCVDHVLEGSVRRAGRRVRVTAQLVTATDGSHLWSERYDRELDDVLVLEDEIAGAIAERLRVDLVRGGSRTPRARADGDAHHAYLEGRYHFARGTPESLARAKACYERAIAADPEAALAYDSMAELYWYLGFFGTMPPREAFAHGTWHALRAVELDDSLAEAHALLGMLRKELDYNWAEVDRELRRAFELNPASPQVRLRHAISGLIPRGRIEEAIHEVERVLETDPLSIYVRWWLGIALYLGRRYDRMVEAGRYMVSLDPERFQGAWVLGIGLNAMGKNAEAIPALERACELSSWSPFALGFLAYACGRAGLTGRARELMEQAGRVEGYVPPTTFLLGHAGLGERDAVLKWIDDAVRDRDPVVMPILTFPFLDSLRSDPRYRAALRAMNLA